MKNYYYYIYFLRNTLHTKKFSIRLLFYFSWFQFCFSHFQYFSIFLNNTSSNQKVNNILTLTLILFYQFKLKIDNIMDSWELGWQKHANVSNAFYFFHIIVLPHLLFSLLVIYLDFRQIFSDFLLYSTFPSIGILAQTFTQST